MLKKQHLQVSYSEKSVIVFMALWLKCLLLDGIGSPAFGWNCKGKAKPCCSILWMPFGIYILFSIMASFSHKSLVKPGLPGFAL